MAMKGQTKIIFLIVAGFLTLTAFFLGTTAVYALEYKECVKIHYEMTQQCKNKCDKENPHYPLIGKDCDFGSAAIANHCKDSKTCDDLAAWIKSTNLCQKLSGYKAACNNALLMWKQKIDSNPSPLCDKGLLKGLK